MATLTVRAHSNERYLGLLANCGKLEEQRGGKLRTNDEGELLEVFGLCVDDGCRVGNTEGIRSTGRLGYFRRFGCS
jgi:hypothetical protein